MAGIFHLMVKRCSLLLSSQVCLLSSVSFLRVERHLMVSEPSFKFRGCKTYIGFGFSGRRHLGLVNDSFREAMSFQGALFLLPTVACSFEGLVLCRLCRVLKNRLVVSLYNLLYVRHATVAQFESVSVEDFPQFVASREAVIDKV